MFSVICNCICLITFGYFIALVVECFRLDYISGRKKRFILGRYNYNLVSC